MFRYIAFVWNASDSSQCHTAQRLSRTLHSTSAGWQTLFESPGMAVMGASLQPDHPDVCLLQGDRGIILGTLFRRGETTPETTVDAKSVIASEGRRLIDSYWGQYVALLVDPKSRRTWVVKDPTGALPCLTARFRNVRIIFSCLQDVARLRLIELTINPRYVQRRVCGNWSVAGESGLNEVSEIRGGECLASTGDVEHRATYWNPLQFARASPPDSADAAAALRTVVRSCIDSWAARHERILVRLSGGLDSSIVLGCLATSPSKPAITALTYFVPGGVADERPWARRAAAHASCAHIERARDPANDFGPLLHVAPTHVPENYLPHLATNEAEADMFRTVGTTAVFTGDGGDGLLGANTVRYGASDYAIRYGARSGLLAVAADTALMSHTSIWAVLKNAVRSRFAGRILAPELERLLERPKMLTAEANEMGREDILASHPWIRAEPSPPWIQLLQLGALMNPRRHYSPLIGLGEPFPEEIAPLYSQPIVEHCLRLPLHVFSLGGRSRGLARRAFAAEVPPEILARTSKDRGARTHEEVLTRNVDFIRELLLDGYLVRERLLDRRKLEAAISGAPTSGPSAVVEIFDYVCVEAWIRACQRSSLRAAA